jgi:hypothetical protein
MVQVGLTVGLAQAQVRVQKPLLSEQLRLSPPAVPPEPGSAQPVVRGQLAAPPAPALAQISQK